MQNREGVESETGTQEYRRRKQNVSKSLQKNNLFVGGPAGCANGWPLSRLAGANFLPLVSSLLAILWLAGCAAPVDRTKQLLELNLANRQGAIANLTERYAAEPEAWEAYSLGVLHGADRNYEQMNAWFDRCRQLSSEHDEDIAYTRLGHWRDEAAAGDALAAENQWAEAAARFARALKAAPEKNETRLRWIEARVMAFGPGREEIRTLVVADRPAAILRWLENVDGDQQATPRLETRVRLASQLRAANGQPGDALAAFVTAELDRLDRDWLAMARHQQQATAWSEDDSESQALLAASRRTAGTALLQEALELFSAERAPAALAKLDTADLVDPGRADVTGARHNIRNLESAVDARSVAEILALGDLDASWLSVWMHRLYHKGRLREAGMVAQQLLDHPDNLSSRQRNQALRVRVAFSRQVGDLDQAREDLRALLQGGPPQPEVAFLLGDVLLAQSRYEEARVRFEQARAWGDDSLALTLRLAGVAFSQNDYDAMAGWAEVALQQDPANAEALRLRDRARDLSGEVAR